MTVVFERPYEFVPPIRSTLWPWLIQRLHLYDRYLRKREGVVDYELRDIHHLQDSIDAGHGILLAPNHCRYADPLIMGWPARELGIHVYAMASWHLFNENVLVSLAIRCMGGFSIFREGNDRQSLETAIGILVDGKRPLVIFPEGTTNRTNDKLKSLLDGVGFIARTAARRRAKAFAKADNDRSNDPNSGKVVVHPIAIKYLSVNKIDDWATQQLTQFERHFGWQQMPKRDIRQRTVQLGEALLGLKETQYFGATRAGDPASRREALTQHILASTEKEMGIETVDEEIRERVRQIRSTASDRYFENHSETEIALQLHRHVAAADLAQEFASYPDSYLDADEVTDTRIVETIQRMQETVYGKSDHSIPLKAVIRFAPAIQVETKRPPKGQRDPLMQTIDDQLNTMIAKLSTEARKI